MIDPTITRRSVLSLSAAGLLSGCLGALQDQEEEIREEWESRDEIPDREEVNRQPEFETASMLTNQVDQMMPEFTLLSGPYDPYTNQHYEVEIEAEDDVDIFVLEDDADIDEEETVLGDYREGDFTHIPEYSAEGVRSYSEYIHVPDDEDYALIIDFHDVSQDRRHLEDPIPIDTSIEEYYYLPFDEFKYRVTDD